jgi:LacI family transcriptional regulator, gluconate utilization system Gnt-I transcriptional repressor
LSDVAQLAQVSPITASRALRGERGVASDLVQRVQRAAEQLGYVPDPAARALASSRSNVVAVLIPLLTNQVFVDLLEAVYRRLQPAGYQTLIGVTHYDSLEEEQLLASYMAQRPAGFLITGFEQTPGSRLLLERSNVPCVHLMEIGQASDVHCVGLSQIEAARAMTMHLLERQRKRVAFVAAQMDARVLQRAQGYRRCLQDAGLYDARLEFFSAQRSSVAMGAQMFESLMQQHPDVDAVFCCNDDLAQGCLLAASRMGLKVPKQVAVAGFNNLAGSDQMLPSLTTVNTRRFEVGELAANMLLRLMRGESVSNRHVDVGFELMLRGST